MTVLFVLQAPDARLRERCDPIVTFDDELQRFVRDLTETRQKWNGLGLAAPQVGVATRVVSLNPGRTIGYGTMVNPTIVRHGDNRSTAEEGCLSIELGEKFLRVPRWDTITVRFQKEDGETREVVARGLAARIIQHEVDHLDGKLIDVVRTGP